MPANKVWFSAWVSMQALMLFRISKLHDQIMLDAQKTNSVNVSQFNHMDPMYTFELPNFSELFPQGNL